MIYYSFPRSAWEREYFLKLIDVLKLMYKADNALQKMMQAIRRSLHLHPELAYQEQQTSALIQQELDRLNIPYRAGLAETGIRAELGTDSSPCIGLRADMDGLPIAEETGLAFASQQPGIMHACGHDGHVAMLLGAAAMLKEHESELPGRVALLFQPAEESGNGAAAMIRDNALAGVDMIFSGHIDTHFPVGQLTVDEGVICSYTDPFAITIHGRGGHAAKPHEAVDAVVIGSNLVMNLQTLISRRIDPTHAAVVTVGRFAAGTVHNVIAEKAVLEGTIRSTHPDTRERVLSGLQQLIHGAGEMYDVKIEVEFHAPMPAVFNDPRAALIARQAAVAVVGEDRVLSQGTPSLGGEDFSFYQQEIPGCMIRFGAEKNGAGSAHSCRFDFDEDVLSCGAEWLVAVALCGLKNLREQQ